MKRRVAFALLASAAGWLIFSSLALSGPAIQAARGITQDLFVPAVQKNYPPAPTPDPWTIILEEDFEGSFPGPWEVVDLFSGFGEYYWSKRSCQATGVNQFSAWAVGGGADGTNLGCGASYPVNVYSWMTYGPFSLAGATAAEMNFQQWVNTEVDYDVLCAAASIDDFNYFGYCTDGNTGGWSEDRLDFSNLDGAGLSYLGQANVWAAFLFFSDELITFNEGAYVDDVVLRKCLVASCPSFIPARPARNSEARTFRREPLGQNQTLTSLDEGK